MRFSKVSNRESQKNVSQWVTDLRKVTGEIPIVVVGNKVDLPERVVKACRVVGPGRIWHRSHMESRMESDFTLVWNKFSCRRRKAQ